MTIAGTIEFDGHQIFIYDSVMEPLFQATEVARLLDYSVGATRDMLCLVENDEKVLVGGNTLYQRGGNRKPIWFLTELGLYNVLSQSRKPIARKWRRVVHEDLISLRKNLGKSIEDQFTEWDQHLDDYYFDEETGLIMRTTTVPGGDIKLIPVFQT